MFIPNSVPNIGSFEFMANKYFKFKQFAVFHDKCAMKVGTDGVLLGAWARGDGAQSILDVGTGSGLIALMAAQRNVSAKITAIEIDNDAALQAKENVENSPFGTRISVFPLSFQDFAAHTRDKFDTIVSNPPFFVHSLPSPDLRRSDARHADSLPMEELFRLSKKILSDTGRLTLIYPFSEWENVRLIAEKEGLFLWRKTVVFPTVAGLPKRVLCEFGVREIEKTFVDTLVIELERYRYTPEFVELTQEFYL